MAIGAKNEGIFFLSFFIVIKRIHRTVISEKRRWKKETEGEKMYQMVVATLDDSEMNLMEKIVNENHKEIKVVAKTDSGKKVIEIAEEQRIDLIVLSLDIKEKNGLETIKKLKELNEKTHVIIVTRFDSVDIINHAISMGVEGYLTKPIIKTTFLAAIKNSLTNIQSEREKSEKNEKERERMHAGMELAEYSLIYNVLFNSSFQIDLERYKKLFGLGEYGYIINIEVIEGMKKFENDISNGDEKLYYEMKRTISETRNCVIGPRIANRIMVYISMPKEIDKSKWDKRNADNLAVRLQNMFAEKFELKVLIGMGNVVDLENIHKSYEESLAALRYIKKRPIVHILDVGKLVLKNEEYIALENKMLESIKFGKTEALDLFSEMLEMLTPLKRKDKINKLFELLVLACHAVRLEGVTENQYIDYVGYYEEIKRQKDIERFAYSKFEYIIKAIRTNRNTRKSDTIKEAISYIQNNYVEDITLDDVADYVGITPQHFSKVFKEETGYNYVEWVSNLRIDMAKRYLSAGEKNIREICYMVGYKDPNYFSRIFKKIVGKTPTEYMRG